MSPGLRGCEPGPWSFFNPPQGRQVRGCCEGPRETWWGSEVRKWQGWWGGSNRRELLIFCARFSTPTSWMLHWLCSPSSLCFSRRSETCYPTFGWLLDTFRKAYLDHVLVWSTSWDRKTKFLPVLTKYVHANKTQNELLISNGPCKPLDWCDLTVPSLSLPPTYTQAIHPQTW